MARFGLLFLNKGKWKDRELISPQWIEEATEPSAADDRYGFMWWLALDGEQLKNYRAAGFGGNYIIIDQANDLVVVTRWLNPSDYEAFVELVYKAID